MSDGHAPHGSDFLPAGPICFISPHLDDAVLSCSHFLAAHPGAVVVTVFAGAPEGASGSWDRLTTGRLLASEALAVRRSEDRAALSLLGATPVWLHLLDDQYDTINARQPGPVVDAIANALDHLGARSVIAPLGLWHLDHVAVADACLQLAAERSEEFCLYLDMPYGLTYPDTLRRRLDALGESIGELSPCAPADPDTKRRAAGTYASQMRWVKVLPGFEASMTESERYWRVAPDRHSRKEQNRVDAVAHR